MPPNYHDIMEIIDIVILKKIILFPRDPKFKTLLKGPDVTQNPCQYSSGCHDVQVTVCWMQIIKNPDCVDEYNIYYWKKLTENEARVKLYSLKNNKFFIL